MDATTGQNALQQARAFKDAVHVNGVILAKLDLSRGGMAFAIQRESRISQSCLPGWVRSPMILNPSTQISFVAGILGDESLVHG